ncbi:nudix hydrolase 9 [Dorcoceras hygrometricum]|uniref:Nudix hydrolase 9 n=1 Tax=Dorcoceras hygrometricum TaxID=472368 RepID=A0A2Z7A9J5_9LAMI|nr:nudix hydrolase 9 [Dorcoceras hygrometricum]
METSRVRSVVRNQVEAKLNQLEHDEPAETMNQLQALKRKDEPADSAGIVCVVNQSQSIVVEEDSGEAIDEPDASNSSIQSRAYMNQLLLLNQSLALHPRSVALKWKEDKLAIWSAEQFWKLSNGKKFYRGFIYRGDAIEEADLRLFVHLRSLGVLTAAGCGIGSVHAVVRSNLLVEPSEEEEGEM